MFGFVPVFRKGLIHYSGLFEVGEEAEGTLPSDARRAETAGPQQVAQIERRM